MLFNNYGQFDTRILEPTDYLDKIILKQYSVFIFKDSDELAKAASKSWWSGDFFLANFSDDLLEKLRTKYSDCELDELFQFLIENISVYKYIYADYELDNHSYLFFPASKED